MICTGSYGNCDRDAVCYLTQTLPTHADGEGRATVIAGPRGRYLAEHQPDGARCVDCALHELDATLTAACQDKQTAAIR